MKTLLPVLLAVVAIGAVVWALMPTEVPVQPPRGAPATAQASTATPAQPAGKPAKPAPPLRTTAASGRTATDRAVKVAQGKVDPKALRTALTAKGPAKAAAAPAVRDDGPAPGIAGASGDLSKWGRQGKPPLTVAHAQVKDSVRAFYGNAAKTGPMPVARLDEVFTADIVAQLNLPADGKVLELGSWPASDRRGFEEVLAVPDGQAGSVGVTVETPDGPVREYVFLGDPNAP